MRLISSKSKGKRVVNNRAVKSKNKNQSINETANSYEAASIIDRPKDVPVNKAKTLTKNQAKASPRNKSRSGRMSTKKKVIVILSCVLMLVLVFGATTLAVVRWQIEPFYSHFFRPGEGDLATLPGIILPPAVNNPNEEISNNDPTNTDPGESNINEVGFISNEPVERNINHINFLLLGIDDHGNTDVIMLASFNTDKSTMEVVSIPRDTMVNVSWDLRKANSIHAYMRNRYRSESDRTARNDKIAEATIEHFRDLFGFHADYMITVNFNAFIRIIDAVGPISYNVPVNVNVDGVRVSRGQQRLNGRQALAVMRSRNSYANHAIGRDYAQQEFMQAVASTILANRNNIKVNDMVDVFFNNVTTNIRLNLLVGFARDFLQLNNENINFSMMPGMIDSARGNSYITVLVDEWLELINEKFNPFSRDITIHDVSILTRGPDRRLMVTDGNWQGSSNWASGSLGPSNPSLTTDSSRPVPGRAPASTVTDDGGNRNPVTGGTGGGETETGGGDGGTGGGDGGGDGSAGDG